MWPRSLNLSAGFLALAGVCAVAQQAPPGKAAATAPSPKRAAAAKAPAAKSGLNKGYLESYLRHLFLWGDQIKVEIGDFSPSPVRGLLQTTVRASAGPASEEQIFYVSSDGKHIVRGSIYEALDNPFRADLNRLTTSDDPNFGTQGATVVVVTFSDFQCPHCRDEAKVLRENILKAYPKEVHVYFKDMPLSIHDWAMEAAIASRCIYHQNAGAFWQFHDWIFDQQAEITTANFRQKLASFIKGKAIDPLQLNQCLERRATEPEVKKSMAEAQALGVNSTPTIFVNGRKLSGSIPWQNLKQVIDEEIQYQKTAKNAGEDCGCEIKLPTPLSQ